MTLFLWMLLYPLVATIDTATRLQFVDLDVGRHNLGHAIVYLLGTAIFLALTVLRYV